MDISVICEMISRDMAVEGGRENKGIIEGDSRLFADILKEKLWEICDAKGIKSENSDKIPEEINDIKKDPFLYLLSVLGLISPLSKDTSAAEIVSTGKEAKEEFIDFLNSFGNKENNPVLTMLEEKNTDPADYKAFLSDMGKEISEGEKGENFSGKIENLSLALNNLFDLISLKKDRGEISSQKEVNLTPPVETVLSGNSPEESVISSDIKTPEILLKDFHGKTITSEERKSLLSQEEADSIMNKLTDKTDSFGPIRNTGEFMETLKHEAGSPVPEDFQNSVKDVKRSLLKILNFAIDFEKHCAAQKGDVAKIFHSTDLISQSPFLNTGQKLLEEINSLLNNPVKTGKSAEGFLNLLDKSRSVISMVSAILPDKTGETKINDENLKSENKTLLFTDMDKPVFSFQELQESLYKERQELQNRGVSSVHNSDGEKDLNSNIDLAEQIIKKINWKTGDKFSEATIRLEPEFLGKLKIQVNLTGGEISAKFFAQTKEAGHMLSNQLQELKTALESQGLKLGDFSVLLEQRNSSSDFQNSYYGYNNKNEYLSHNPEEKKEEFVKFKNKRSGNSQMDYLV